MALPAQDAPPPAPAQSVTGARVPEVRSQTPRPPAVQSPGTPGPQSRTLQFSQQNRSDAPRSSAPRRLGTQPQARDPVEGGVPGSAAGPFAAWGLR
nr:PREDICTED: uncharacterized protein LOC109445970 [Rhinolophus sinicus]